MARFVGPFVGVLEGLKTGKLKKWEVAKGSSISWIAKMRELHYQSASDRKDGREAAGRGDCLFCRRTGCCKIQGDKKKTSLSSREAQDP